MKKVYKSKVDMLIIVMLIGGTLIPIAPLLYLDFSIVAFLIVFVFLLIIILLLFDIRYIINDSFFVVKYSVFFSQKFLLDNLDSIKSTSTLLSAPAASFDRLELNFHGDIVVVSPKDKLNFIKDIAKKVSHGITISV